LYALQHGSEKEYKNFVFVSGFYSFLMAFINASGFY